MDEINTITPLQSDTIKAALKAIAANVGCLISLYTGKPYDGDMADFLINNGVTIAANAASIWYAWKAIRGRINATAIIAKKESPNV